MGIGSASLGLGFSGESWTGMIGKWEKRKKRTSGISSGLSVDRARGTACFLTGPFGLIWKSNHAPVGH